MIYLLIAGSSDSYVISISSTLEGAQKSGDKIIDKHQYLSIEEWGVDTDCQYPIKYWHKLTNKRDPAQSFDWTMV